MTEAQPGGRWWIRAWVLAMTLTVAAPVLRPGYVLSYDAVAVPRQTFLPDSFGVGVAFPRAVPAETFTVAVTYLVDGQWVQKGLLVACLLVAGLGAARLVPARRRLACAAASTAYVWNPYVAERLVLGHWWLLLGYAVLPWLVVWSVRVAKGERGARPVLLLLLAAGSTVPSAGLMSSAVVLVMVASCTERPLSGASLRRLATLLAVIVVVEAPWWLPGLLHGGPAPGEAAAVFASRAENALGVVGSVLGLGGVWNGAVVPESRGLTVAVLGTGVAVLGAVYGLQPLRERLPDGEARGLLVLGGAGLALALWTATAWGSEALDALVGATPGFGLLRDAQKFAALWALLLSVLVALALERVSAHTSDAVGARAILVGGVLLPVVLMPDLAWGVGGRLVPVALPPSWSQARDVVARSDEPGDVLVLPWGAFRRFDFNDGRTSLDPAPRWLPRPSVVDDRLVVANADTFTVVPAESGRARAVEQLLESGAPASEALAGLGIGWVVVERGTPGEVPPHLLDGTVSVLSDPQLELRRVPSAQPGPGWPSPATQVVLLVDLGVLLLLVVSIPAVVVLRPRE